MSRDLYWLFVKPVQERGASTDGSVDSNDLVLPRRTSLSAHDDDPFETPCLLASKRESSIDRNSSLGHLNRSLKASEPLSYIQVAVDNLVECILVL